jgi:hypothetical protein
LYNNAAFKSHLSRYAKSDDRGVEAYAETFADWHHSAGTTKNPSTIAMARYEGWRGANSITASGENEFPLGTPEEWFQNIFSRPIEYIGEVVNLTLQNPMSFAKENNVAKNSNENIPANGKYILIHDTFNEDGPIIEGDYEVVEPSEEEMARADEIWAKVCKDLGLDSEGN